MSVDIKFDMPKLAPILRRNRQRLLLAFAAAIQTNRGLMFDKEGAHNGHKKWAPLKFRNGQILTDRGTLRKSIAPSNPKGQPGPDGIVQFSGESIKVGTKVFYAAMMNWGTTKLPGGVLRPKNAQALRIPLPKGRGATEGAKGLRKSSGDYIFRKSVRIPERRFDAWNEEDQQEVDATVANLCALLLNGGRA